MKDEVHHKQAQRNKRIEEQDYYKFERLLRFEIVSKKFEEGKGHKHAIEEEEKQLREQKHRNIREHFNNDHWLFMLFDATEIEKTNERNAPGKGVVFLVVLPSRKNINHAF